jgi:hypothetical protein
VQIATKTDIRSIYVGLNKCGYICDPPFAAKVIAALNTAPQSGAFLFGASGTGKTYLPEIIAELLGAKLAFQQCFPGTREEDLMVRMVPSEDTKSGVKATDGVIPEAIFTLRSASDPVVLVFDEWDKTRASADAFLLDFLQNGRLRYAGRTLELTPDERKRLHVFVTMNDERDISEVLLRRLPKIDFELLPALAVRQALTISHNGHPLLDACITLYRRCMAARLPKPCTIQELRQLIDAATLLGAYADWDMLVYQFVTKTPEAHSLLIAVENSPLPDEVDKRPELSIGAYGMADLPAATRYRNPRLPGLSEARGLDRAIGPEAEADTSKLGGIIAASDSAYDALLDLAGPPMDDPADIGGVATVNGDVILVGRSLPLGKHAEMQRLWGHAGEIAFIASSATMDDVMALRGSGWKVVSYSTKRLVAKTAGMELLWTPEEGVEIVVSLSARSAFEQFLQSGCPESWLAVQVVVTENVVKEPSEVVLQVRRPRRVKSAA